MVGYARALTFRSNLCYRRGMLGEAQADVEHALEHLTPIRAPLAGAFLLDILIERDELAAAEQALERYDLAGELPETILHTLVLERRARLRLAQHHPEQAILDANLCQQRAVRWEAWSPSFLPWRSTAALALAGIGRRDEALKLASSEVEQARAFTARRALGIALRVQGLLAPRAESLSLVSEAVLALQGTGARLEYARAMVDLGGALRRASRRTEARTKLRAAVELAEQCDAGTLAARARSELRSVGGRPLHARHTGRDSLSPAEIRVATMAATGMSNRDIAQALFVTLKTVEWHLGQTYRKLGLRSRTQLATALDDTRRAEPPAEPLAPAR